MCKSEEKLSRGHHQWKRDFNLSLKTKQIQMCCYVKLKLSRVTAAQNSQRRHLREEVGVSLSGKISGKLRAWGQWVLMMRTRKGAEHQEQIEVHLRNHSSSLP